MKSKSIFLCGLLLAFAATSAITSNSANAQDKLYRIKKNGKVSRTNGKIQEITPLSVTFDGQKIPVWEISKLTAQNELPAVDKARDRIESSRYQEAIDLLETVKPSGNPVTDAEVSWNRAVAKSELAFSGGAYTAVEAGSDVQAFLKANSKSYHFVPATDLMGRLAMADGKLSFAAKQFGTLTKSRWPKYVARGHFYTGEALLRAKKYPQATAEFDKLIALSSNDDVSQRYKRLARCQKAKVAAVTTDPAASISQLEAIIKQGDPEDKELFAYAYNALGACYMKGKDLAEAEEKFLFTHLLFDTESGPHAEAVYQLANIWTAQKQTDRASEARQILNSRYRNTWWASQAATAKAN